MKYYKENENLARIVDNNHPVFLSRLQNIFIESFSVAIFSINQISKSSGRFSAGLDKVSFKTSGYFEDRYLINNLPKKKRNNLTYKSPKNLQIQRTKIITTELKKQFQSDAQLYNRRLCLELIPKVLIKTLQKNYRADTVKRLWIPKEYKKGLRPLGILTIRERVLQTIILLSCNPIIEYTSDSLSFGFREKRSAVQCVAYLFNKLSTPRALQRKQTYVKRVGLKEYLELKGKQRLNSKIRVIKNKTFLLSAPKSVRKRRYHNIF
jgi:hypothetical protein